MKKSTNHKRLERRLLRQTGTAISDFKMIEDKDVVMCCLSGGKDSYTMLHMLRELRERAPVDFRLIVLNLDQGQPGFPKEVLPNYLGLLAVDFKIITEDTYSIVRQKIPEGQTTCSLCSRLRRGVIYRVAKELGANKIALGHHRDDIVETFFLNLFFGGRLKAMPPKLKTDDGAHIVIRPLAYCAEHDIARFARAMEFPIIPCDLCGSQENLQRKQIKAMLQQWQQEHPYRSEVIFRALRNIVPSHLLDEKQFDFSGLNVDMALTDLAMDKHLQSARDLKSTSYAA